MDDDDDDDDDGSGGRCVFVETEVVGTATSKLVELVPTMHVDDDNGDEDEDEDGIPLGGAKPPSKVVSAAPPVRLFRRPVGPPRDAAPAELDDCWPMELAVTGCLRAGGGRCCLVLTPSSPSPRVSVGGMVLFVPIILFLVWRVGLGGCECCGIPSSPARG